MAQGGREAVVEGIYMIGMRCKREAMALRKGKEAKPTE